MTLEVPGTIRILVGVVAERRPGVTPWAEHAWAAREVLEETGIDCRPGSALHDRLCDWYLENVYDIYPAWRHRYAPGVTRNTEHLFSLEVPAETPVRLDPREHTASRWLPWREAAEACYSPSNAEAILMLPRMVGRDLAR